MLKDTSNHCVAAFLRYLGSSSMGPVTDYLCLLKSYLLKPEPLPSLAVFLDEASKKIRLNEIIRVGS